MFSPRTTVVAGLTAAALFLTACSSDSDSSTDAAGDDAYTCLLYTSPSPRDS